MSVRPHPTKHRRYPGETWWIIDLSVDGVRDRYPVKGSYEQACEIEKTIRQESVEPIASLAPKIKELIVPFMQWYRSESSHRTVRDIRFTFDLYVIPRFGNLRPGQLTLGLMTEFRSELVGSGLSHATVNKHLNYFSSLLRWAADHGYCRHVDFRMPRFSKKKTVAEQKRPLSRDEVTAIYEQIEQQYKLLFLLMADHGLRQSEAMSVKWKDVDIENETIQVRGKGNKYRRVPFLSDRFVSELCRASRDGEYLVINKGTGLPYATIWKALERAAKRAGITRHVNHHLLRHTFATHAAEDGMNAHALQRILGHSSIETTNKIYTNVGHDFVGDEARKIRKKEVEKAPAARLLKLVK